MQGRDKEGALGKPFLNNQSAGRSDAKTVTKTNERKVSVVVKLNNGSNSSSSTAQAKDNEAPLLISAEKKGQEPDFEQGELKSGEVEGSFKLLPDMSPADIKKHPLEAALRNGEKLTADLWTYEVTAYLHRFLAGLAAHPMKQRIKLDHATAEQKARYEEVYKKFFESCETQKHLMGAIYQTYNVQRSIASQNIFLEWYADEGWTHLFLKTLYPTKSLKGLEFIPKLFLSLLELTHQIARLFFMHLTLQSARLYAAKKADVPLKDSSTWLLAKDSFMMYLSGAVSLGILSTWIATLTNGWLEDNPAALYSFSAYVFAPLALAVADPRWNLKLKTSAAYIGVGVLACLAFVDIIKQLIEFTETAASLCQEMRDELSSDLYNSDNDAYRRLYCSKAYMAHFGVYADITETAFYGVIVGAVAVFCFMRGVTIAKDAYYREVPKHKALDALKRAYDGHWAIQGDSMDEEGEAVEVRYPEVTSSVNLWSLLELVAGVSLLISLPVLMWHLFPKYEQDMLDAFTAQTIKNQESGINGINPKTYAETVSIIRDGQWAFVPFLYQEQAKLIPALAFLGAVLLVRKYYEVVESGNSYALHRTVSVEDIHAVELRILRGDDVGKPLYDIERKAEPKSKSCPSLSSCFMRMFGGAKAQASRTDEAVKRAAANRVNGDGGPADVDMSYDTTKTTTREGTLTV